MPHLPWYVFGLLAALFISLASIFEKSALRHEEPIHFSAASMLVIGLMSSPFLLFVDFSAIPLYKLASMFGIAFLAAVAFFLVALSLKTLEAGEQGLILAFAPAATALSSFLFLGEALTQTAMLGIFLVVLGLVVLEFPSLGRGRMNLGK